jgi:ATP-dependent exoDNAse (exonuclease V) beta subunit
MFAKNQEGSLQTAVVAEASTAARKMDNFTYICYRKLLAMKVLKLSELELREFRNNPNSLKSLISNPDNYRKRFRHLKNTPIRQQMTTKRLSF